jgi:hypothetical protein
MMERWNIGLTKILWLFYTILSFQYSMIPELSLG